MTCLQCSAELSRNAKFCTECGAPIASATPTIVPEIVPESTPLHHAERRQLTVLFCDVVNSTALSEALDPEDLRDVMIRYQEVCGKVIERFEGHIAKYLGDGLLVAFGYPVAHEDDAQRAVRAALGMLEAVKFTEFHTSTRAHIPINIRTGIHTGLVLMDEIAASEHVTDMVGETPKIAMYLEEKADINSLVISGTTAKLVAGLFETEEKEVPLFGNQAIEAFSVLHESTAHTRFEASRRAGVTALVGRAHELALLRQRWLEAMEGSGHTIFISGEAGIGKSRITLALKEIVAREPNAWLIETQCSPYYRNTAFYPIANLFERTVLHFSSDDDTHSRLAKLEGYLAQNGLDLEENVPLFLPLLSISTDKYRPLDPLSKTTKQRTMELLIRLLIQRAGTQPVLFIAEDLHWADPSTLELFAIVLERIPSAHVLTLLTFRPEFSASWVKSEDTISLGRLGVEDAKAMVEHLVKQKQLPKEIAQQILTKTDGVPLFVEELTRTLLESGSLIEKKDRFELAGELGAVSVPTTLKDSLMARLDRMASAKRAAQVASVLGREFTYPLLDAIYPGKKNALESELSKLVSSGLIFRSSERHDAIFTFKHALVQDAAYDSLLRSERQEYHRATAIALRDRFPDLYQRQPELVAQHFTAGGTLDAAIPEWLRAGKQADARSANHEASSHYQKGIQLLSELGMDSPARALELPLQLSYGMSIIMMRGYSVPEVKTAIDRAREICPKGVDFPELPMILWLFHVYNFVRGDLNVSVKIAEEFLTIARSRNDSGLLLEANSMLVLERLLGGNFLEARKECAEAMAHYVFEEHRHLAYRFTQDPLAVAVILGSWAECWMGYPDRARELGTIAVDHARKLGHNFSLNYAIAFAGWLYYFLDMPDETERFATEALQLAQANGYFNWMGDALILLGWAKHHRGESEAGLAMLTQGMDIFTAIGRLSGQPGILNLKIDVLISMGKLDEAQSLLDERWKIEAWSSQQYERSIGFLLEGDLALAIAAHSSSGPDAVPIAEEFYRKAIEDARQRHAKNFEMKAWLRLFALFKETEREAEIREEIQTLYSRFTEGWDTPLLQQARKVIDRKLLDSKRAENYAV
ncbi:MAG TPA: AAA family ATPase [Candidatus Kapabacteria bacterium]